jgi:hypothetical protein
MEISSVLYSTSSPYYSGEKRNGRKRPPAIKTLPNATRIYFPPLLQQRVFAIMRE